MTDLEMDLIIANARIAILENALRLAEKKTCSFGEGVSIKPDGVHELDPCSYKVIEKHENVTVEILHCKNCGKREIIWHEGEEDG